MSECLLLAYVTVALVWLIVWCGVWIKTDGRWERRFTARFALAFLVWPAALAVIGFLFAGALVTDALGKGGAR